MSGVTVELDFLGLEKRKSSTSQFHKLIEQKKTIRSVQSAISKINPQFLKPVMESGVAGACLDGNLKQESIFKPKGVLFASENPFSAPSTPKENQSFFSFFNQILSVASETPPGTPTAPLTIFYKGTVSVFDVPRDKAGTIMKLAEVGNLKTVESVDSKVAVSLSSSDEQKLLEKLNGDLPIARKKSLQRFLERRKERLTSVSSYVCGSECAVEKMQVE